ncbi:hypothetical protein BJ742DRAFT_420424 [Cladochytrium replicatum]|nr:hypothetical protein BJ742DRAFT_420424 [Cladochytrium replicatum]
MTTQIGTFEDSFRLCLPSRNTAKADVFWPGIHLLVFRIRESAGAEETAILLWEWLRMQALLLKHLVVGNMRNSIYLSGLIDPRGGSMIQIPQKNQGSLIDSSAWCDGAPKQRTCRFKYLYLRIDSRNLKNSVSKKDNITFYFLRGEGSTIHNFDLLASEEAGTTLRAVLPLSTELSGKWVDIIIVEDPQQVRGQSAKGAWEPDGVVREPTLLFEPRRSTYEFTTDDLVPAFQALVSYSRPTPDRIPRSSGDAFVKNSILRHSVYQQMNQISEQLLLENQKSGLVEPERCATSSSLLGRALSFGRLCNPIPFDRYTRILIVGDGVQNDAAHLLRYLSYYPVTHIDDVSWEGIGTVPIDRIIPFSPSPEQPSPRSSAHEKNIFAVRFEDIRIGLNYLLPWSYAGDPIAGADLKVTKFGYLNLPHFADFLARAFGCDRRVTLSAQSLIQESLANSFGIVERSDRAFASGLLGLQPLDECETITDRPFMIIFVSRSRRKILNAPELARALKTLNLPLGVKLIPLVVQYEQWPASTLIRLVRCSGGIIAMHSSILSLSVFLPRNAFVIELFPFAIASESLRKYKDISSSMRGISYVSWENKAQANTRIFPDKTQKDGGIKHLNEELQSTIVAMRSSDAPPCCSHPFWTFRLNQDTVVDIDEISLLLKKFKPSKPS